MKKRYLIVILCIIAVCILVVIFIVKNKKTINNYDNLVFEYNQKVKVSDIIPVRKDEYINTLKIGKNNLKYEVDKTIYNITYEVVDTSAPLVLLSSTYTYNIGDENDLKKRILCADNYDKRPNCFIEGTYNFNIVGNYNLKYIAIDSFNNKTEKEFTLIIKDKNKTKNNLKKKNLNIKDVVNKYKNDKSMIGIDVSAWQNEIDFNKVKEDNIEFVMIRIGYGYNKDGEIIIDKQFYNNFRKAKEANLKIGLYFYSYAKNIEEAKNQADWIVTTIKKEKLDLPIAFDFEDWNNFNDYNLSLTDLNMIADTFMNRLEEYGYKSMLYGSYYYLQNIWDVQNKNIWLAHYSNKTDYPNDYQIWQLSNIGKVNGINTDVDINVLYK